MVTGISVVIPNYNGVKLFKHTLPTVVEALQRLEKPSEIIVVDDCSTDNSVAFLQEHYPFIKILVNTINGGFSVTSNRGVSAAAYDKVLLLNSDVKLTPDYFTNQFKYFDAPDTFGVMGRIVGWEDEKIQDGAKWPSFHGAKLKTSGNYLLKDERQMRDGLYSMYLSGANALFDKEKFLFLGGFNEMFSPFYVEDAELSLRAWRIGFKCYYDHSSVCRHQVSTSIKSKSKKKFIKAVYNRNKMFLHALHLEGWREHLWYAQLLPEAILRTLTLNFYFLSSVRMFFKAQTNLKASRIAFNALTERTGKRLSVKEVAMLVTNQRAGDKILF